MGAQWTMADEQAQAVRRALAAEGAQMALPEGGAAAWLAWALVALAPERPWIWITDGPRSLSALAEDAAALAPSSAAENLLIFPAGEGGPDDPLHGERLRCLLAQPGAPGRLVLTCAQALLQAAPPPRVLAANTRRLQVGDELNLHQLAEELAEGGYAFTPEVQAPGEACLRGGLLDVWPATADLPLRIEFFGATVESLRRFEPLGQRSVARCQAANLPPLRPGGEAGPAAGLWDYLPPAAAWVWLEAASIAAHGALFEHNAPPAAPAVHAWAAVAARGQAPGCRFEVGRERVSEHLVPLDLGLRPSPTPPVSAAAGAGYELLEAARRELVANLLAAAQSGERVLLCFETEGAQQRFAAQYPETAHAPWEVRVGALSSGFRYPGGRLLVAAEADIYGRRLEKRGARRRAVAPGYEASAALVTGQEIQPGEWVVHLEHGIGKYLGLFEIAFQGVLQEVLSIEYADQARLYVPVTQAHLVSRYMGSSRHRPALHKLGGQQWQRQKAAAQRAVRDYAADLLETQAHRETAPGFACPPDLPWQHEFEAAFPYAETPDQISALAEIKRDLESPRPMERLLCGDVGYGKTEVAMRAAFKVALAGRQVAVLTPTTVLAQQHYETFRRRLAAFPIRVEVLSRFVPPAARRETLAALRSGACDMVIGTHRLLQADVAFKNLGLAIIDEEQRFGVLDKERFKTMRREVDVLSLSATPIPRTLYLSLVGARDLSTIQTAPRARQPIETIVAEDDDALIREAILRELNREGQVFFLHNRVQTIELMRRRLAALVPEARLVVGHGQLPERELANVMQRFVAGEADVLLCTTIIESGLDIPNVNTILIHRAERFGLADLYQLRGRVGRDRHKAYAYLLLPRHGRLFHTMRRRIDALQRYGGLGAGLKLALQDLEIRGAGNVLGAEQSGHIAAVGFELYCNLLRRAVARLKGETPPPVIAVQLRLDFLDVTPAAGAAERAACLPHAYIEDENLRVRCYRRLAAVVTETELEALHAELRDRFGSPPPPAARLLQLTRLRLRAHAAGLSVVETRGDRLMCTRQGELLMPGGRFPRLPDADPNERLEAIITAVTNGHP